MWWIVWWVRFYRGLSDAKKKKGTKRQVSDRAAFHAREPSQFKPSIAGFELLARSVFVADA